jgi:cobalt/nickel transport system ATP-binding protein
MSHHIVEVKNIRYSYPNSGESALDGVTFRITHGESVGIVGANGAGKSTLLMHLIGFLFPAEGTVRVGDYPVTPKTLSQVRRSIGLIFQDPDDQLFMPTVFEDVAFGPLNMGLPAEEVEARVLKALDTVGVLHLKDRPSYKLSGGEKRAVAIAAVLSMTPDILIMDEPSSALDPLARRRLINMLSGFRHTKIIVSHDLDMVLDLCERTIVLSKGRVIADGPTKDIFLNEEILTQGHLEKPFSMQSCPICGKK